MTRALPTKATEGSKIVPLEHGHHGRMNREQLAKHIKPLTGDDKQKEKHIYASHLCIKRAAKWVAFHCSDLSRSLSETPFLSQHFLPRSKDPSRENEQWFRQNTQQPAGVTKASPSCATNPANVTVYQGANFCLSTILNMSLKNQPVVTALAVVHLHGFEAYITSQTPHGRIDLWTFGPQNALLHTIDVHGQTLGQGWMFLKIASCKTPISSSTNS